MLWSGRSEGLRTWTSWRKVWMAPTCSKRTCRSRSKGYREGLIASVSSHATDRGSNRTQMVGSVVVFGKRNRESMFRSLGVDIEFLARHSWQPTRVGSVHSRDSGFAVSSSPRPLARQGTVWPVFDKLRRRITLNKKSRFTNFVF
jgi:hypothetical protein